MLKKYCTLILLALSCSGQPTFAGGQDPQQQQVETIQSVGKKSKKNAHDNLPVWQKVKHWLSERSPMELALLGVGGIAVTVGGFLGAKKAWEHFRQGQSNSDSDDESDESGKNPSKPKKPKKAKVYDFSDFKGWGADHKAIIGAFAIGAVTLTVASLNVMASHCFKDDVKKLFQASEIQSPDAGAFINQISKAQEAWAKAALACVAQQSPDVIFVQEVPENKARDYAPAGYSLGNFTLSAGTPGANHGGLSLSHGLAVYVKDGCGLDNFQAHDLGIDKPRYAIYSAKFKGQPVLLANVHLRMMNYDDFSGLISGVNKRKAGAFITMGDFNLDGNDTVQRPHNRGAPCLWLRDLASKTYGSTFAGLDGTLASPVGGDKFNKKFDVSSITWRGITELLDHAIYGGCTLPGGLKAHGNPGELWSYVYKRIAAEFPAKDAKTELRLDWKEVLNSAAFIEFLTSYDGHYQDSDAYKKKSAIERLGKAREQVRKGDRPAGLLVPIFPPTIKRHLGFASMPA